MDFDLIDNLTAEQRALCAAACKVLMSLVPTYADLIRQENEAAAQASENLGEEPKVTDVQTTSVSQFKQFLRSEILSLKPAELELVCNQVELRPSDLATVFEPVAQFVIWRYWPVALSVLLPALESEPEWAQLTFTVGQQNQKVIQSSTATVVQSGQPGSAALLAVLHYNLSMHLQLMLNSSLSNERWEDSSKVGIATPRAAGFDEALNILRAKRAELVRPGVTAVSEECQPPSGAIGIADSSELGRPGIVMGAPSAKIHTPEVIVPDSYNSGN